MIAFGTQKQDYNLSYVKWKFHSSSNQWRFTHDHL